MHDAAATTHPFTQQVLVSLTAVIYPEPDAGGFSAEIPALPGCYTQGEMLGEVQDSLREAAEAWLASAHDQATRPPAERAA
jgi:predicted RNase H-like HicB family nuclease